MASTLRQRLVRHPAGGVQYLLISNPALRR